MTFDPEESWQLLATRQLAAAKYATDPNYADILTRTMRTIEASAG